jgi:aspartyl-tRNA(Asn)/glutamyl-tRNA(Gln) amidotransferase subunit A
LFDVIAGPDAGDPYGQVAPPRAPALESFKGVRIAWLERCGNRIDSRVAASTVAVVRKMEALGAIVEPIEIDFVSLEPTFLVILESGVASRVAPHLECFREQLDPHLVETVEIGLRHSAVALQNAGAVRSATFRDVQRLFERYDFIVSPTLSAPPLPLGPQLPDGPILIDGQPSGALRGGWYPYTFPFNLTGHPAISLPCGTTPENLPISLQIAGKWHEDQRVLALAALTEAIIEQRE